MPSPCRTASFSEQTRGRQAGELEEKFPVEALNGERRPQGQTMGQGQHTPALLIIQFTRYTQFKSVFPKSVLLFLI